MLISLKTRGLLNLYSLSRYDYGEINQTSSSPNQSTSADRRCIWDTSLSGTQWSVSPDHLWSNHTRQILMADVNRARESWLSSFTQQHVLSFTQNYIKYTHYTEVEELKTVCKYQLLLLGSEVHKNIYSVLLVVPYEVTQMITVTKQVSQLFPLFPMVRKCTIPGRSYLFAFPFIPVAVAYLKQDAIFASWALRIFVMWPITCQKQKKKVQIQC